METTLNITAELLDLFVQHQLTTAAQQPPFDHEAGRLGLKRYRALLDEAARRLAGAQGKPRLISFVERGR